MSAPKSATEQASVYEPIIASSSDSSPKKRNSACRAQGCIAADPSRGRRKYIPSWVCCRLQDPLGNSALPKHTTTQRQENLGKQRGNNQWTQYTLLPLASHLLTHRLTQPKRGSCQSEGRCELTSQSTHPHPTRESMVFLRNSAQSETED